MKRFMMVIIVCVNHSLLCASEKETLPSWNDGASKESIVQFVGDVTNKDSPHFVPVSERIAVFDNDGTLWSEKPAYFQISFAKDRVESIATSPSDLNFAPYLKGLLSGDKEAVKKAGKQDLLKLMTGSHAGTTPDEFKEIVQKWVKTAKHPRFDRPYTEMVFQPMLELLEYLRANGFKTYIVTGGGTDFVRAWSEDVYGIPPEQVVGSNLKTDFKIEDGKPILVRNADVQLVNDGPAKPVSINQHIGRRPIAAFGNSDGDLEMLQWTHAGEGKRLCLIVHHTDDAREWAYDKETLVGKLDEALTEADQKKWTVVNMKNDWKVIYPFEK